MKKIQISIVVMVALAAFTFTACSKSGNTAEADAAQVTADSLMAAEAMADSMAQLEAAAEDATTAVAGGASWSADLDEWVLSGTGMKTITLDGIAGEGELSAEGQAQLDLISTILENNASVNAVIKGHTTADQKIGNGKPRAVWTKAKLIIGHDAVGSRISTEGVGASELIEGVDANDASQKRITVSFSK